ncbi:hypothetical protein A2W67_02655 [Candidatus Nomurabacteria bacterium RIFCSPLOWO2_02_40_28]|uniref:Uncharacterized protein n=2 Tax=Candidatus Nomuraibacteriota TaxID=1752729 RepID=A0A837HU91_9BACT|nr:MAG: hypothetical protein UT27_C0007G0039 [Candidatus Nomurabacteria bacterium GW2011_GWD2_39_12]KKR20383.1 MAG: hypothetical protein UT51_C0004G0042 [Candidatus Nomurabacteria bacterium GW2011_GWC2_39_41]KKR37100.1 MAG: hypothetical protein UT70_C0003G0042 [Candidatus Nomurabacteria bacterium GW2011_GWE2_40_10]KKR38289.1 MAG: hypothetical protein UT73_C0004G0034 [Candidatus Nomurabacteria bacterium GW2011_GWB1_40_11]KKR39825.1 MAG: hypothetical protein UT74_C0005G0042 [Parcubacteria group b
MELKPEQIEKFKELHKGLDGFEKYSEDEVREIANGVANYYLTLFKIYQRVKKEKKWSIDEDIL